MSNILQKARLAGLRQQEAYHKRLAKVAHPDAGGTVAQFRAISEARDRAIEYLKGAEK